MPTMNPAMTPEHEALRRIGGSDIAAVLGRSRWKTPLDVYMRLRAKMVGESVPSVTMNESMKRGVFLEPGLRAWAGEKLGETFTVPEPKSLTWVGWEWATYSPDGIGEKSNSLLELKSPDVESSREWGREMTPEVPPEYLLQGAWGCMVTNTEQCFFGALIGGELRIFKYVRSVRLEKAMLEKAKEFVEAHVLEGVPPEPTYGDKGKIYDLFPKHTEKYVHWDDLRTDQRLAITDYLRLRASIDPAQRQMDSLEASLLMTIGMHRGVTGIPGQPDTAYVERLTWSHRNGRTDWKSVAQHLAFGALVADEDFEALSQSPLHRYDPSRALTLSRGKGTKR